jgi:hypothetical protein
MFSLFLCDNTVCELVETSESEDSVLDQMMEDMNLALKVMF